MSGEFRGKVYDSILDTIGATPLVKLGRMAEEAGAKADVLLKLEFFNPLASVKDRIGFAMIKALEDAGKIGPEHGDRGADIGQYRHRAGLRRCRQGLQADPGDARIHVAGTAQDADDTGGPDRADRGRQGHEGRHRPRP